MNALHDRPADVLRINGKINHVNVATRRHDRFNWPVAQPHDACDHCPFARFNDTGGFRFRYQGPNLLIRDPLFGFCLISKRPQNRARGSIQERDKG
jgi:hypothetical protein